MNTSVMILGRTGCGTCTFTKRALQLAGITYETRNIDTDETAAATARRTAAKLGTTQLPIVICDDGTAWAGLRLDLIANLVRDA